MIVIKIFSSKNYNYSFSNMEERLMRRESVQFQRPKFKEMFGALKCDDPAHNSQRTVVRIFLEDNSLGIGKSCCDEFRKKILQHFNDNKTGKG